MNKNIIRLAIITALILLIPLFGNAFVDGWNWGLFDFVFAFILIFGTGVAYELITRKIKNSTYKLAVGLGLLTGFLVIWVNLAVGIIGDEDNPVNVLYFGVLFFGFIGSIVSQSKPKAMAKVLFTAATMQFLVPFIAFFISQPTLFEPPGIVGVLVLNSAFATMFLGSGLLFRQASAAK